MGEWFLVTLRYHSAERELTWAALYNFGCIGLEDSETGVCRAYFPADIEQQQLLNHLRACPSVLSAEGSVVEKQDWHSRWMDSYESFCIGRFFIRPSWKEDAVEPGTVEIVMDPAGAFGTGTHATTQLCLRSLPDLVAGRRYMIDVGCGSGILSIAARKISAQMKVVALDCDPAASLVCRSNSAINCVSFPIVCGTLSATRGQADLIVANLQFNELLRLKEEFYARTSPGASLLLSGILEEQVAEFCQVFEPCFTLQDIHSQDEWVAFVYRRP